MPPFIPYGRQSLDEADIEAVCAVLRSDWLTSGPEVEAFEGEFADAVGAKHAVAVSNATAALHLALRVARVGPGDRVVTSPNTFLASAHAAAYVGATPDFCDVETVGHTLDAGILRSQWRKDTKAVVAVAYAGQSADMPAIAEVARTRGAVVIEDACHGVGGGFTRDGRPWKLGGHPWADLTTFSFHPVKTMTTGEGGMLVTDDDEYARRARLLRSHGVERDATRWEGFGGADDATFSDRGSWIYEMQELGYNYRLTDLQCALGRSQLARLPEFVARRREIVALYNEAFAAVPWMRTPCLRIAADRDVISWHLYTVQIDFPALGRSRAEVMARLKAAGVGTQVLYIPVHLQPWYRRTYGYALGKCPVAEALYSRFLSLPLFPAMTAVEIERVIEAVRGLEDRSDS